MTIDFSKNFYFWIREKTDNIFSQKSIEFIILYRLGNFIKTNKRSIIHTDNGTLGLKSPQP